MKKSVPGLLSLKPILLTCLLLAGASHLHAQNIDFGKSYINVTKGLNGGTVETGDTLEIRATLVVRSGTYDSCRFQDVIPAGTVYIPGTIRVLTNEGKIYKQFTDAANDDPGRITGSNVTINLGFNPAAAPATAFRRGRVANTHKPNFGNSCIMISSFRIRVTAATYTNIATGGGNMTYKSGLSAIQTFTFPANILQVYPNYGICTNTVGVNAIGTESNGTFGSGRPRNRGASLNVPAGYTYQVFTTNQPNDYNYGIANNTSTRTNYTTLNTWPIPDNSSPTHRVFSVWDIIGDHTGAVSPTAGNPPADTVANANGGYMLIVNAAYRIDSAFQQTISGLCPNTYYELSCWMRNICSKCGCDSNGVNATGGAGYIPTAPGDSSGVSPNITFEIDGVDYYTTGNIRYSGQWVRKGFTFLTGLSQSSFTLKYFNNAPGGGGNDWALDDISVTTCSPNMKYAPSNNPTVCDSNTIKLSDTVRSFFNNYVYYKWQRSTNGGATWTDVTGALGPASPYWNGTAWEYVSSYTVPASQTLLANNGDMYRLVVATTLSNLSDVNCRFTDVTSIVTLNVIDCYNPLQTSFLTFSGEMNNNMALLRWKSGIETEAIYFDIEKSADGSSFSSIGTVYGYNDPGAAENIYYFTDPVPFSKTFYRIVMKNTAGQEKISNIIVLSADKIPFSFITVINPFENKLECKVFSAENVTGTAELINEAGSKIAEKKILFIAGINNVTIENTGRLSPGIYFLKVSTADKAIQKIVVKL